MKLAYAGASPPAGLIEQVEALDAGPGQPPATLEVLALEDVYRQAPVDATATLDAYRRRTGTAIAEGYRGLRVVADVTDLVRTGVGLDAFARYGLQLGPFMAKAPFSAMCAFSEDIGSEAAMELACVHPSGEADDTPFRAVLGPGGVVCLTGELDLAVSAALESTLQRLIPNLTGPSPIVDMSGVTFVDHRSLATLDSVAEARRTDVRVVGAGPLVARLVSLLDFPRLRVGASA